MRLGSGSVMVRQRASFYTRTTNLYVDSQTTSPVGGRILIYFLRFPATLDFRTVRFVFRKLSTFS